MKLYVSISSIACVFAVSCLCSSNTIAFSGKSSINNRFKTTAIKLSVGDQQQPKAIKNDDIKNVLSRSAISALVALSFFVSPAPSFADGNTKEFKLPPIDFNDQTRCELKSSAMGQANAARDKLYDLRQCNLSGKNAVGYDLSGVIMSKTDASSAKFAEAYFSKSYLRDSTFDNADFTNAIVDRANFRGSSLKGTIFTNAVLTGTSFEGADVENADFSDAYLGDFDIRSLCRNPTLKGENPTTGADTKLSVGCK